MFSRTESIPYSSLSSWYGEAQFFLDYISGSAVYAKDYREILKVSIHSLVDSVCVTKRGRVQLLNAIAEYNLNQNRSPQVESNLSALLDENTYTVCAGQQAGLFTGPLFTVYKAMTAVSLCELLKKTYSSAHFVPIFWVASEDHDLSEVNRLDSLDLQGGLNRFSFPLEYHQQAIQDIVLSPEHWREFFSSLKEKWTKTEFSDSVWKLLESSKTVSFASSFVRLMSHLFRDRGLLFVEPRLLRELAVPLNEKIFLSLRRVEKSLKETQANLTRMGYTPRLHLDESLPFFYSHQGKRKKIYSSKGGYSLRSKDTSEEKEWTSDQLKRELSEFPSSFSHNVMLRPFIQDSLFPNIATVVGPHELEYYAELQGLYEVLDKKAPYLFPRVSLTLLEKRQQRIQNKWHLSVLDILNQELEKQIPSTVKKLFPISPFTDLELEIKKQLERLSQQISPKALESIQPSIRKIQFEISRMQKKHEKIAREEQGYSQSQITKLQNSLTPYQKAQERVFPFYYFMNLYGDELLNAIFREMNILDFRHRVLYYA